MHPSVLFSIWLFLVLLVQVVPAQWLAIAGLLGVVAGGALVRRHFGRLLRRSRWILLTLLLTFLFLTPGERLWAGLPVSWEGLSSGSEHLLRLLAVLLALAWLIGGRPDEWLLSALWGLLGPLCGRSGQRLVVRLALTLRYAAGEVRRRSWRSLLAGDDPTVDTAVPQSLVLPHVAMTTAERCWCASLMLAGLLSLAVLP